MAEHFATTRQYIVEYDDPCDPGFPLSHWRVNAYSGEGAVMHFLDTDMGLEGFRPLRWAVAKTAKRNWHKV